MNEPEKQPSDATEETRRLQKPKGLEAGECVAEFRILRELGRGGMGVVYLAHDEKLDRDVALKLLLDVPKFGPEYEARFLREARNAARLDHPNVVQVYSAGRAGEISYIAMQFVKGNTLDALLIERGLFEPKEALRIIADVCRALSAAHQLGIVHRDIKPSNVMIEESGRVKVMDFGLSRGIAGRGMEKVTQSGIYLGTPEYSSPEQCETNEIDGRSDIYSLGVVLYEMLSGRPPHSAPTPLSLFKKIMEEVPQPIGSLVPALPKSVCTLVETMMTKDKNSRYATAADVASDIEKILAGQRPVFREMKAGAARTTQLEGAARTPAAANRRFAEIAACVLLVVAAVAAALLSGLFRGDGDWVSRGQRPNPPNPVAVSKIANTAAPTLPLSMVVFDFRNTTTSKEHEWMELGVPEMLIGELNQAGFLRVVTRDELLLKMREIAGRKIIMGDFVSGGTPEKFQLTPETQRLLTCFGAQLVVCGSFLVQGDQVKIIAEVYTTNDYREEATLTETACGTPTQARIEHLATRDVQGAVAEVFSLVDKLSQNLTEAIRAELPPVEDVPVVTTMTVKVAKNTLRGDQEALEPPEQVSAPLEFLGKAIERRRAKFDEKRPARTGELAVAAKDEITADAEITEESRSEERQVVHTKKGTGGGRGKLQDAAKKPQQPNAPELDAGEEALAVEVGEEGKKVVQEQVLIVEEPKEGEPACEDSLALKCRALVVELKKLSEKDLFEIARLRWKMQKVVEDSVAQDSPEVKIAVRVLQLIENGEDFPTVLRMAIEGKLEEGDLIKQEVK